MPRKKSEAELVSTDLAAMGLPALLRVPQIRELLGISRETLYRAIKRGDLLAMRAGGSRANFIIRRDDLARWISSFPAN